MVLITIVNGVYKPTYNWGVPPCSFMFIQFPCLLWRWSSIGWYFLRAYINQRALQHSLDLFSTLVALCPELFGLSHWLNRWHPVEVPQTFLQDQLTFRLSDIFRICSYVYIYIVLYWTWTSETAMWGSLLPWEQLRVWRSLSLPRSGETTSHIVGVVTFNNS